MLTHGVLIRVNTDTEEQIFAGDLRVTETEEGSGAEMAVAPTSRQPIRGEIIKKQASVVIEGTEFVGSVHDCIEVLFGGSARIMVSGKGDAPTES